jgi:hypothetical protein
VIAPLLAAALAAAPAAAEFDFSKPFDLVWRGDSLKATGLDGHSSEIVALAETPDGRRLMTAGDRTVRLWDLETLRPLYVARLERNVYGAALSPDGTRIAAVEEGGLVRLLDAATGKELSSFKAQQYPDRPVWWDDGKTLTVAGRYGRDLQIFDAGSGELKKTLELVNPEGEDRWSSPSCFALSPDGRSAASFSVKKGRLYDLETGALVSTWEEKSKKRGPCSAAFSPDSKTLLVSRLGKAAVLRALPSGNELSRMEALKDEPIDEVAFARDGRPVSFASDHLRYWNAATGKPLDRISGSFSGRLVFSRDGKRAYTAYSSVSIADAADGKSLPGIAGAQSWEVRIQRNADGKWWMVSPWITSEDIKTVNAAIDAHRSFSTGFGRIPDVIATMREQANAAVPMPAAPPALAQGPYESRAAFDARVQKAKEDYETALAERQKKLAAWRAPEMAIPTIFLTVFGEPRTRGISYDPDAKLFSFELYASHGGGFSKRMTLQDTVPNENAEAFERRLASAAATVRFRFTNNEFTLQGVSLIHEYKEYTALPAGADPSKSLARVDVSNLVAKPADPSAPALSYSYSDNPELAAKQKELDEARRKQADAEKLAALEAQLAALTKQPEISSDVDAALASRPEDASAYAVVVGVEKYQNADLPKAMFAERDARSVAKRLEALGVPPRNMKVLVGAEATRAKLAGVLEDWLPNNAKAGSKVYFYFSGHGAPDAAKGGSYLVPWDGDPSLLKKTGYPLSSLYGDLAKLPASRRVAILDACFSGAGGRSLLAKGARPLVNTKDEDSGDVTVLAAAAASEITGTLDSQGHGLFTYHFLKALGSGGRPASALHAELKPRVQDEAARQSREQTPVFRGPDASIP